MKMKRKLLFILLLTISICSGQVVLQPGDLAPPVHITDYLKNEPADKSLEGKYIIIDFWATWCGPCLAGVPEFNKMSEKYKSRKDVVFLSMTYQSPGVAKGTLDRIDFKTVVVSDQTRETFEKFGVDVSGVMSVPYLVLIDKWGKIYFSDSYSEDVPGLIHKFLDSKQSLAADKIEGKKNVVSLNAEAEKFTVPEDLKLLQSTNFLFEISDSEEETQNEVEIISYKFGKVSKLNITLQEILAEICKVQPNTIEVPESFKDKRYNLTYVNPEKLSIEEHRATLKKLLLANFKLKENRKESESDIYVLRSSEPQKLIISDEIEPHSSNNLTHLIVGGSIWELIARLYEYFQLSILDETKLDGKYEFLLKMGDSQVIACELESYGLLLTHERRKVEHLVFEKP